MLTTSQRDEDIVAAYRENVAGYLVKSDAGADFLELIDMVEAYWKVVEFPIRRP